LFSGQEIQTIKRVVQGIEEDYQRTQGLILSEHDLQCLLYHRLFEYFSEPEPTIDVRIQGVALHAEISWYDENGKLYIRPDITVLDPTKMSILHGITVRMRDGQWNYGREPAKGFQFDAGRAILIEIKLCHERNGPTNGDIHKFRRDVAKLERLMERLNIGRDAQIRSIFVIFNKTDNRRPEFDAFLSESSEIPNLTVIYGTGLVEF